MTIGAFLTAQLPARTMSRQCCYLLLYLPNLSWKGRGCASVCVWVKESVGFCWTWRNTPLRSHKGTLSPAGQRHLSSTKETKHDVSALLWYGKKRGESPRLVDTGARASVPSLQLGDWWWSAVSPGAIWPHPLVVAQVAWLARLALLTDSYHKSKWATLTPSFIKKKKKKLMCGFPAGLETVLSSWFPKARYGRRDQEGKKRHWNISRVQGDL